MLKTTHSFTYIFQAELVEAEFKVNDSSLVEAVGVEQVHELAPDLLVKFVVRKVQA